MTSAPLSPSPAAERHESRYAATPVSVPSVRRGLRTLLDDTGLPEDELYDLLLAACEAATNAIEHAQEPSEPFIDVRFEVTEGQVTIVVRDHGRWRHGPATPFRGRGLEMMRTLADTTVDSHSDGTTVTMRSQPTAARPPGEELATG